MLFVTPDCQLWLSSLLVAYGCRFDRRAENGENIIMPGSRVDRGARGAQSQSLKVSQSLGRPGPFQPISGVSLDRPAL